MKKIVKFSLCLIMLLLTASVIFAAGGGQSGGAKAPDTQSSPKKLVLYTEWTEGINRNFLNKAVGDFQQKNPGVTIEVMSAPLQQFDTFFKTAVAGNEQIDVVEMNIQFFRDYVTRGFLKPLDGLVDFNKTPRIQTAWDQEKYFSRSDKRYGIPMQINTTAFYYNPAIFDQYKIEVPKTWDDIFAMKDKLAAGGISPMVYAGAEPWWNPMHFNAIFYQMTKNKGLEVNEKFMKGDFSPEVIKPYIDTLQFFADLDTKGIFIPGTQGLDFNSALTVFSQGKAAMYFLVATHMERLGSVAPGFKYHVVTTPVLDKSLKSEPPGSIGVIFGVYKDSKFADVAGKFVEYYGSPQTLEERFNMPGSSILSITPGIKLTNTTPVIDAFYKIAPATCIWLDALWEPEIITAFQRGCQSAILKQKTPTQVMDEIIAQYKQLREQKRTFY